MLYFYRNETLSSEFENVSIRFESSFGTGKRYFKMFVHLWPNFVEKLLKIKCGKASLIFSTPGIS